MWALVYRLCSRLEGNRLTLFPPPIEARVIVFVCAYCDNCNSCDVSANNNNQVVRDIPEVMAVKL